VSTFHPTSDLELNAVLQEFVTSVQAILGSNFVGAYLQGSFAAGDWDIDSDVDFLVVVDHEISGAELPALQAMHSRIYDLESHWAQHLEGSYFPRELLRSSDLAQELLYLDNTARELVRSRHDNTLVVRWVVREYGILLAGPDAAELIEPVPTDELRREIRQTMHDWAEQIFANPSEMDNRWYQPFAVLSYCRMLHTLQSGRVFSKPVSAEWAKKALDSRWAGLIQRARDERPNPSLKVRQKADAEDFNSTLEFISYALDLAGNIGNRRGEHTISPPGN
jgi:predicted nucleotidyltransferase